MDDTMQEDAQQAPEPRAVTRGDELYVTIDTGPACGSVICHGRDGVTVKVDDQPLQVPWGNVLGHKARMETHANVVDRGEDGAIVEHDDGTRSYIHGLAFGEDQEDPDEEGGPDEDEGENKDEEDGMAEDPRALLAKAAAIANKAGLSLQDVQGKSGHTRRWVKTTQDAPKQHASQKSAPGKVINFKSATGHGVSGKVVASGKDGVTVLDDRGGEHRVPHGEYDHAGEQAEKPAADPSAQQGDGQQDKQSPASRGLQKLGEQHINGDGYKSPFRPEHFNDTPKRAAQPVENSLEGLFAHAKEALPQYQSWAAEVSKAMGAKVVDINKGEKPDLDGRGAQFIIGPVKKADRVKEKAEQDERGNYAAIKDIIRGTLALDSLEELQPMWDALEKGGVKLARAPKDRFAKPTPAGYRDILMNITMPNGHVCELQINGKDMLRAKKEAHKLYEKERTLLGQIERRGAKPAEAETEVDPSVKTAPHQKQDTKILLLKIQTTRRG